MRKCASATVVECFAPGVHQCENCKLWCCTDHIVSHDRECKLQRQQDQIFDFEKFLQPQRLANIPEYTLLGMPVIVSNTATDGIVMHSKALNKLLSMLLEGSATYKAKEILVPIEDGKPILPFINPG